MTRVKVCGVTSEKDAGACLDLGVDTLGINFWPGTKRRCEPDVAARIAREFGARAELVAVFVDADEATVRATLDATGIPWAQFHGDEAPELVARFLPRAYKAVGVRGEDPLLETRRFPGDHVLLDAYVPGGMPGGTGAQFDWELARAVARERRLTLAGGLTPANVGDAIRAVRPHRIDVASGVESSPGVKDPSKVRALVEAVRAADAGLVG